MGFSERVSISRQGMLGFGKTENRSCDSWSTGSKKRPFSFSRADRNHWFRNARKKCFFWGLKNGHFERTKIAPQSDLSLPYLRFPILNTRSDTGSPVWLFSHFWYNWMSLTRGILREFKQPCIQTSHWMSGRTAMAKWPEFQPMSIIDIELWESNFGHSRLRSVFPPHGCMGSLFLCFACIIFHKRLSIPRQRNRDHHALQRPRRRPQLLPTTGMTVSTRSSPPRKERSSLLKRRRREIPFFFLFLLFLDWTGS